MQEGPAGEPELGAGMSSPYPGLRPFNRDEAHLFYGRDNSVDAMIGTLEETRFLAVLGPSGSGKSSLVRSGLFIHLEAGLARKAGSRWTFLDIRHPRQQPFRELARELLREERRLPGEAGEESVEARRKELRKDPLTLVNWWLEHRPHAEENLLLLVDQFEELLGYGEASQRDDVEAFVDLLQQSIRNAKVPVYVVLTMRSEFLGGCTLFPGLAEQINRSLNLVPRMTRRECELAITGPVDGETLRLEPLLVTTLLNDMNRLAAWADDDNVAGTAVTQAAAGAGSAMLRQADLIARRADQLPLMQHVLNWMWQLAAAKRDGPDAPILLTLADYDKLGGLAGALSRRAHEVMESTGDPELTEKVFTALTDQPTVSSNTGSAESSAVRRPRTIRQLAEETRTDERSIRAVVEPFRADGVSMLTPGPDTPLTSKTEVDISHESLIRQWSDLRGWIRAEAERGRAWRELVRNVEQEGRKEAELLRGLGLSDRRRWWRENVPHAAWSDRYGGQFDPVAAFLDRSVAAERRRRIFGFGLTGALVLVAVAATLLSVNGFYRARKAQAQVAQSQSAARASQALASAAQVKIDQARLTLERARELTDDARRDAENAERQMGEAQRAAAAAQAQARMAAAAVNQAVAQRASVERQRREITSATRQLADEFVRPLVRQASAGPPGTALPLVNAMAARAQPLMALSPADFSELTMDLRAERAELAEAELDGPALAAAADAIDAAARQAGPEVGAVMRSQARTARGHLRLLQGRYQEAVAFFAEADQTQLTDTPSASLRAIASQARSNALLGRAQALLQSGNRPESAAAAVNCLRVLGAFSTNVPGHRLLEAECLIAWAAASPNVTEGAERLNEAGRLIVDLDNTAGASADVQRARLRLARTWVGIGTEGAVEMPPFVSAAIGSFVRDWAEPNSGGLPVGNRTVPYVYRRDAVAEIQLIDDIIATDDAPPGDAFQRNWNRGTQLFVYAADGLIGESRPEALGILVRMSDVNTRHSRVWLDATTRNPTDFASGPAIAIGSAILNGAMFARTIGGDEGAAARFRLQAEAERLLALMEGTIDEVRYPDLPDFIRVEEIADELCGPAGGAIAAPCAPFRDAAMRLAAEGRRRMTALESAALDALRQPSVGQVWARQGIALDGYDPVSCAAQPTLSAGDGWATASRRGNAGQTANAPRIAPACALNKGRYVYSDVWDGRVWLFENPDNLATFRRNRRQFVPQFGGYDAAALAGSEPLSPPTGLIYPATLGGQIYLFTRDPRYVTFDIATARQDWIRRRGAATANSPPRSDPNR